MSASEIVHIGMMLMAVFAIVLHARRITRLEDAVGELYQEIVEAVEILDRESLHG